MRGQACFKQGQVAQGCDARQGREGHGARPVSNGTTRNQVALSSFCAVASSISSVRLWPTLPCPALMPPTPLHPPHPGGDQEDRALAPTTRGPAQSTTRSS